MKGRKRVFGTFRVSSPDTTERKVAYRPLNGDPPLKAGPQAA
jgi:hypothetical protein